MRPGRARGPSAVALVVLAIGLADPAAAAWRVVDPEGEPVGDARIELHLAPTSSDPLAALVAPSREARSDAEGRVDLPLPSVPVLLVVDHPAFGPWVAEVQPGEPLDAVHLGPGRSVSGKVRAEDGSVDGGEVCASWSEVREEWAFHATWERCTELAQDTTFTLGGLEDGLVQLVVRVDGYLPLRRQVVPGEQKAPVELGLIRGVLLTGAVTGPRDEGLRGAEVRALDSDSTAATGPGGGFELPVPALPVVIEARAPGYREERMRVQELPPPDRPLHFHLTPAERVIGTLLGEDAMAPAGGRLVWEHREGGSRRAAEHPVSEEDGSFALDLPQPGDYTLVARAPGYRDEVVPELAIGSGETEDLGVIVLSRGAGILGSVVDAGTGDGVSGVEVLLLPLGTGLFEAVQDRFLPSTVSGDDGEFELLGLRPGRYELRAWHSQYAVHTLPVTVEKDVVEELSPLHLDAGTRLLGRLVDRSGAARPGLTVKFFDSEHSALVPVAKRVSDAVGEFSGPTLGAGSYRVTAVGERLLLAQEIAVPEGAEELELELLVGGVELLGLVRRSNEPVSGGTVIFSAALDPGLVRGKMILHAPGGSGGPATYGLADSSLTAAVSEDGTFRIEDAPSGLLWGTYVDGAGWTGTRQVLVPDQARAEVVLDLSGVSLGGRVTDAAGAPLPGARLHVLDPTGRAMGEARSDLDGRFSIADLPPGGYHLEASADGHATRVLREIAVREGAPPLEVVLEPAESERLEVSVARQDGSPVAGSLLSLLDIGGRVVRSLPTDGRGVRVFEGLPEGDYFVVWSDPVAGAGLSPALTVRGSEPSRWEAVLPAGGPLHLLCMAEGCSGAVVELLTVHSANGLPIGPFLSGMSAGLRFSEDGGLSLGRLSPGTYLVSLWVAGRRFEQPIQIASGQATVAAIR